MRANNDSYRTQGVKAVIEVRGASHADKDAILGFCQNTFHWGDYIAEVWDIWMLQGDFCVATYDGIPVGLSHISYPSSTEAWFEGLRVHPDYRRHGVGKALSDYGFALARSRGAVIGRALIDGDNVASQSLSGGQGFSKVQALHFWSLEQVHEAQIVESVFEPVTAETFAEAAAFLQSHETMAATRLVGYGWQYQAWSEHALQRMMVPKALYLCRISGETQALVTLDIDAKSISLLSLICPSESVFCEVVKHCMNEMQMCKKTLEIALPDEQYSASLISLGFKRDGEAGIWKKNLLQ